MGFTSDEPFRLIAAVITLTAMKSKIAFVALLLGSLFVLPNVLATASKDNVGTVVKVDKLRFKGKDPVLTGKPLIVEFWATWCPPCRTSIPHLNEVYKKYKDKGLEIIGVTDEDLSTVNALSGRLRSTTTWRWTQTANSRSLSASEAFRMR